MGRFAPLVLVLGVVTSACGDSAPPAASGEVTPAAWTHDFVAETLDGATLDAGDYEGQDLLLWFWAPW